MRRMQQCDGHRLTGYAFVAPVERIADAPNWGRAMAGLGAVWTYIIGDIFATAILLIVASGALDYLLGVRAAKARGEYDGARAHAGFVSKIAGVGLMMLVRLAEYWIQTADIVDTRGFIAAALTLSLFAVDLESIQQHREAMGAKPIPGLSTLTGWLNSLIGKALPATVKVPGKDADS